MSLRIDTINDRPDFARTAAHFTLHEGDTGDLQTRIGDMLLASHGYTSGIAMSEGKPVGFAIVGDDDCCMIFVKPDYRNRGIGTELMQRVLDDCGRGLDRVWAWPGNDVESSIHFWTKLGIDLARIEIPMERAA